MSNIQESKKTVKRVVKKVQKVAEPVVEASVEVSPSVEAPVEVSPSVEVAAVESSKKVRKPRTVKPKVESSEPKVKASKVDKATKKDLEVDEESKKAPKKRTFTLVSLLLRDGSESTIAKGGKHFSKTPAGAARKAATQSCKELYGENDDDCQVDVLIKETTKNSSSKEYFYRATRKLNNEDSESPKHKVEFKGKEGAVNIKFRYSMTLKSLKKNKEGDVQVGDVEQIDESVL